MTRIDSHWLRNAAAKKLTNAFRDAGKQIYFVGGCVRNALLGTEVSDFDLATDALPAEVLKIAADNAIKAIPTGIDHGTLTLVAKSVPFEVTTFRSDVATDGRHATVNFGGTLEEDAKRRDFTMNALYADADGAVYDPENGLVDLKQGIVRFIGNPSARLQEDYLRLLRFFRFHAWYGNTEHGIEPEGYAACAENVENLGALSKERITAELLKLLSAPDPSVATAAMATCGALAQIIPGANTSSLPILVHHETTLGLAPDPVARLAVLGGDISQRLRLSKKQSRMLEAYQDFDASIAALGYRYKQQGLTAFAVRQAVFATEIDPRQAKLIETGAKSQFPVSAQDLQPAYSGEALGKELRRLEARWIASEFKMSKAQLLA